MTLEIKLFKLKKTRYKRIKEDGLPLFNNTKLSDFLVKSFEGTYWLYIIRAFLIYGTTVEENMGKISITVYPSQLERMLKGKWTEEILDDDFKDYNLKKNEIYLFQFIY